MLVLLKANILKINCDAASANISPRKYITNLFNFESYFESTPLWRKLTKYKCGKQGCQIGLFWNKYCIELFDILGPRYFFNLHLIDGVIGFFVFFCWKECKITVEGQRCSAKKEVWEHTQKTSHFQQYVKPGFLCNILLGTQFGSVGTRFLWF